jgi:hypothetical protein
MLARSSKVSHTARPHASNRTAKGTAMNQRKMRIGMSIRGHGAALTPAEVEMWRQAVTAAEVAGTFFIAQAYHCAVATKPG